MQTNWLWWRLPDYVYTVLCCHRIGRWRKRRKESQHKPQAVLYAEQQEARCTQEMEISLMEDPRAHRIPLRIKGMHMPDSSFMDDTIQFAIHNSPNAFPEFLEKGECEMLIAYETGQIIVLPCTKGKTGVYDCSIAFRRFNIETASPTQSNGHTKPQWISTWPNAEHINPDTRFHCRVAWFYTPDGSMVPGRWPNHFREVPAGRPTLPFWVDVQEVCVDGFPLTKGSMWRLRKFSIVLDLVVIEAARERSNIKQSAYHHRLPCSLQEEWGVSPITPNQRFESAEVTSTTGHSIDELGPDSLNLENLSLADGNSTLEHTYLSHPEAYHSLVDPNTLHSSFHNTLKPQLCQTLEGPAKQNARSFTTTNQRQLARGPSGELIVSTSGRKPGLSNPLANDRPVPLATINEEEPQGMQGIATEDLGTSMSLSSQMSENAHERCLTLRDKVPKDHQVEYEGGGTKPLLQHLENPNVSFAQLGARKVPTTVGHSDSAGASGVEQMCQPNMNALSQDLLMQVKKKFQILHTEYDLTLEKNPQILPQNVIEEVLTRMGDLETTGGAKVIANVPTRKEDSGRGGVEDGCESSHTLRGGHAPAEALLLGEIEQGERMPLLSPSPPPIRPNIRITRDEAPMEIPNLRYVGPAVRLQNTALERFNVILRGGVSPRASPTPPFQTRTQELDSGDDESFPPLVRIPTFTTSAASPSPTSSSESPPTVTPLLTTPQSSTQMPLDNIPESLGQGPSSDRQIHPASPSQVFAEEITRGVNNTNPQTIPVHPPAHPPVPSLAQANGSRPHAILPAPFLEVDIPLIPHGFVSEFYSAVDHAQRLRFREHMEVLQRITVEADIIFRRIQQMPLDVVPNWRESLAERHIYELMNQHTQLANRLCRVLAGRPQGISNEEWERLMRTNFWRWVEAGLVSRRMTRGSIADGANRSWTLDTVIGDARSWPSRVNHAMPVQDGASAGIIDDIDLDDDVDEPEVEEIEEYQTGYVLYT